ncbi:AAA-domain-containing protein [Eremomyces bilateralis CBS 781.70]|uniref:AAA-domain-containing protein n=1 Tax=Eremomyces bilateralis CBS 781.70 TaxID=1392243 RepID=A0A6G1GA75_9PEZI|nr:AAA-domain-containing protein [Eremomyces bilateralis CBS 781.70]KAF1814902.1 AAA-domain-containing protein [Eremomyces bilateralis CBS 781.70]
MSTSRLKRNLEELEANKSDPDDSDYDNRASNPQRRRPKKSSRFSQPPSKRRRQSYGSDGDDIDDDIDDSQDDFGASTDDEDFTTTITGRRVRKAAKNRPQTYKESSVSEDPDDIESPDDELDLLAVKPKVSKAAGSPQKLVVKLHFEEKEKLASMVGRTRRGSRSSRAQSSAEPRVTRRSSRLSHEPEDRRAPLVELTNSGRHVLVAGSSHSPEPVRRQTRGRKGPVKAPSAIIEVSQETSNLSHEFGDQLVAAATQESDAPQDEKEDNETEADDIMMEDGSRKVIEESEQEAPSQNVMEDQAETPIPNDDEDDDEGPVTRRRNLRSRRDDTSSPGGRRSQRIASKSRREKAQELRPKRGRGRRTQQDSTIVYDSQPKLRSRASRVDYRVFRPELVQQLDEDGPPAASTPSRARRGAGGNGYRSLFSLAGPFGGMSGPPPLFGGPDGVGATGGVDSDSSDDDGGQIRPRADIGGAVGMTPTTALAPSLFPQTHNADPHQGGGGHSGTPANFGKVKDKQALADADPLGVDQNVTFDGVGGLDDHINQLKEMVALPLLYPEVFQRFHVTPPRGVLFHGPPGTGKTLLARALASSVSSHGRKVTFYMRKGADTLSKWVGEAERQLRLLFEEARKNQPSIIFFDEIDGLAPVRSSKQEQIHASIVATLLALMDGMDGRGQVIVIGATNRPDSVDPALRRPGRFDREFYFPLPGVSARRSIIDIHTKGWEPPLALGFKDQLAGLTKGYGGADLRALCTEAALNAVQGTYPQIYQSNEKLHIDPSTIKVLAKDFMISVNKMIPSSERSATSGAAPLPKEVEPLLKDQLQQISALIDSIVPQKKKLTALQEAEYDDREDEEGFEREIMQQSFEKARVFRPRLLIRGGHGMGQNYLGSALLNKFETLHVQSFDLATLLEDSARSPEAAVVQLFKEARRHKPSVIYVPNVDVWYETMTPSVIKTFTSLLRTLHPNDPVLVLGILEAGHADERAQLNPDMLRDLFGYSLRNQFELERPGLQARREYFDQLMSYVRKRPSEFPDPENRKKRKLEELSVVQAPERPQGPTKEELKAQKKQDRHTLNLLKLHIQPVMDQIRTKYKKFRTPVIDDTLIQYLYDEADPSVIVSDLPREERMMLRPFEMAKDKHGVHGLQEVATGKFFYNVDVVMIEKRLSNGYYKRPKDFLADIKRLAKDARNSGDVERTLKANELLSNVEVDMEMIEKANPALVAESEAVYAREQARQQQAERDAQAEKEAQGPQVPSTNTPPNISITTTTETTGPVHLGEPVPGKDLPPVPPYPQSLSNGDGSHSHGQSNGSTVPSRLGEDTQMSGTDDLSGPTHAAEPPSQSYTPQRTLEKRWQRSAMEKMPPNSQPEDFHNSASTTTSGQKTTDHSQSNRSSDRSQFEKNTQSSNGASMVYPDFSALPNSLASEDRYTSSDPSQQHEISSQPGPRSDPTNITSLLNGPGDESMPAPQQPLVLDEKFLEQLHSELVDRSSGLSVEQLEQVNAALMNTIWKTKRYWNRNKVIKDLQDQYNLVIQDIEEIQFIANPSQANQRKGPSQVP